MGNNQLSKEEEKRIIAEIGKNRKGERRKEKLENMRTRGESRREKER